jgi:hypothetical protein
LWGFRGGIGFECRCNCFNTFCGTKETSWGRRYIKKKAMAMRASVSLNVASINKISEWQHVFIVACCCCM